MLPPGGQQPPRHRAIQATVRSVAGSGTASAATALDASKRAVMTGNQGGDRHDSDCYQHGPYPYGGYYGGGLGLLSWIL